MASQGRFSGFFKFVRWTVLLALIVAVYLAMKTPSDLPTLPSGDPAILDNAKFEQSLLTLSEARSHGEGATAHFTANEINAAIVKSGGANGNIRVAFADRQAAGYFSAKVASFELFLHATGTVGLSHGRLIFTPTEVKLGDLPLPLSFVGPVLQKKLQEPEMQERLRMPEFISRVEILNGELVIDEIPKRR